MNIIKQRKTKCYLILPPLSRRQTTRLLWVLCRCRKCLETQQQQLWAAERKPNGDKENIATPTDILQSLTDHHFLAKSFFFHEQVFCFLNTKHKNISESFKKKKKRKKKKKEKYRVDVLAVTVLSTVVFNFSSSASNHSMSLVQDLCGSASN